MQYSPFRAILLGCALFFLLGCETEKPSATQRSTPPQPGTPPPAVATTPVTPRQAPAPWGHVTVLGQVNQPGRIALDSPSGIRLSEAIKETGGFSDLAILGTIWVTRGSEGHSREVVDFMGITQGVLGAEVLLWGGDVVYVPQRPSP